MLWAISSLAGPSQKACILIRNLIGCCSFVPPPQMQLLVLNTIYTLKVSRDKPLTLSVGVSGVSGARDIPSLCCLKRCANASFIAQQWPSLLLALHGVLRFQCHIGHQVAFVALWHVHCTSCSKQQMTVVAPAIRTHPCNRQQNSSNQCNTCSCTFCSCTFCSTRHHCH